MSIAASRTAEEAGLTQAGLTQAELAQRMGIAACSLARIEASVGSRKHAPSLATLRKYAAACGRRLSLGLT